MFPAAVAKKKKTVLALDGVSPMKKPKTLVATAAAAALIPPSPANPDEAMRRMER